MCMTMEFRFIVDIQQTHVYFRFSLGGGGGLFSMSVKEIGWGWVVKNVKKPY